MLTSRTTSNLPPLPLTLTNVYSVGRKYRMAAEMSQLPARLSGYSTDGMCSLIVKKSTT